jgi:tartrate-resistant acid phosphatase type 5
MSIIFYTIGDWGKLTNDLKKIAKSMNNISKSFEPNFILSLGDNFYPDGVESSDDPKWNDVYENIFTGKKLYCPWYAILGNHDYLTNPDAQINYYLENKKRWVMPSRYYSITYNSNKKIQIVAIDTVELGSLTSSILIPEDQLKKTGITNESKKRQLQWLETTLATSNADWLIVIGHYNLYTAGYHDSNHEMISILKPLFVKYKVDMYICGHCHNLEHLSDTGIEYIVSGSGGKKGSVGKIFQSKFGYGDNGFTVHKIEENKMTTMFIDAQSNIIYSFDLIQKRN